MDLTSDNPFWALSDGLLATFPPLRKDASCDVVVFGAGITGSMVAERLSRDGHRVIVVDRRDVCTGSTSASTALLQYEIDITLVEMAKLIGRDNAELAATRLCLPPSNGLAIEESSRSLTAQVSAGFLLLRPTQPCSSCCDL